VTTTRIQPLASYLSGQGFTPHPDNRTWLDRRSGHQIIRVLHEPEEATLLICLTPRSACLYEAVFSPGTPDAVIIAAVEAALTTDQPPETSRQRASARGQATAGGTRRLPAPGKDGLR
jgi:hypothetical protein